MKRALLISHVPPFPEISGDRLRIARNLRLLTEMYDVDPVYMSKEADAKPMRINLPVIFNMLENPDKLAQIAEAAPGRVEEEFGMTKVRRQFAEFIKNGTQDKTYQVL